MQHSPPECCIFIVTIFAVPILLIFLDILLSRKNRMQFFSCILSSSESLYSIRQCRDFVLHQRLI